MFNFKLFKLLQNRFFSDTVVILSSRILPENLSVEIPSNKYGICLKKKKYFLRNAQRLRKFYSGRQPTPSCIYRIITVGKSAIYVFITGILSGSIRLSIILTYTKLKNVSYNMCLGSIMSTTSASLKKKFMQQKR